ncbi:MAG: phosphodiesterase [Clostridia bacterium]
MSNTNVRILVASDIHGSRFYCEKLLDIYKKEKADYLIILGDVYYHGARNNLPIGYEPKAVAVILNKMADKLTVIKGNCDSDIDQTVSDFEFIENFQMLAYGKRFFFTHGNKYNIDNKPLNFGDALIYGHTHKCFIEKKEGVIYANPGSVSLPKDNTAHSYILIEKSNIILKDLNGDIITSMPL